ncbi:fimbrial protein [Pinirhizobacter soli]|uniref:fimbrial protein n=1 Tax=Pinirhizobacter soli TaxID=2786953 RepID=UPI00202A00DB|nr:fimbrial protein [Pinirhizobacter soli]
MKQLQIAAAIALAMGLGFASHANAQSFNGGTITFTGTVTDDTCPVKGGAGTDGGANNFIVALSAVNTSALATDGAVAGKKSFNVVIGGEDTGCDTTKVASMKFLATSPRVDATTGTLTNALPGEATNTNIQLLDAADAVINLADGSNSFSSAWVGDTATITYAAQYKAIGGAATAGLVSTSVVYSVEYK